MILALTFLGNLFCAFQPDLCDKLFTHPYPKSTSLFNPLGIKTPRGLFQQDGLSPENAEPIVEMPLGAVEGYVMQAMNGKELHAFEGIRYAEPRTPRFQASVPKRRWEGILHAKKPGPDCLQISGMRLLRVVGNEDCLTLNIYTPKMNRDPRGLQFSPKLPVMIFIHGGTFFMGGGRDYGPAYLGQEQNIILVTINYRLGVLGFFSTGGEESLGNWGLKDQALAIKFVYDNIEYFGGDKTKITLAGQSAGAASVHWQMLSTGSIARNLFSRAISFSGNAFSRWAIMSSKIRVDMINSKLAKSTGCPQGRGRKAFVNCLKRMDGNFLVAAQRNIYGKLKLPLMLFTPVVEPELPGAFLTNTAKYYYENDLAMKIPYMNTNTDQESSIYFMVLESMQVTKPILKNWRRFQDYLFDLHGFTDDYQLPVSTLTDVIAEAYFGKGNVFANGLFMNESIFREWTSDNYFTVGNRQTLKSHCKIAPTYSYIYKFRGKSSVADSSFLDYRKWEATHSDDLASIFNSSVFFNPLRRNTRHHQVSKKLIELITTFANEGTPRLIYGDGLMDKYIWKPVNDNPSHLQFLEIDLQGNFQMIGETPEIEWKLKLWESLGF